MGESEIGIKRFARLQDAENQMQELAHEGDDDSLLGQTFGK